MNVGLEVTRHDPTDGTLGGQTSTSSQLVEVCEGRTREVRAARERWRRPIHLVRNGSQGAWHVLQNIPRLSLHVVLAEECLGRHEWFFTLV